MWKAAYRKTLGTKTTNGRGLTAVLSVDCQAGEVQGTQKFCIFRQHLMRKRENAECGNWTPEGMTPDQNSGSKGRGER